MNNLMAKIKGFDYQGFFLAHGEKVGMGVVGVIVVMCLAFTSWAGYGRSPAEMEEAAQKVQQRLQMNRWPDSERTKFPVEAGDEKVAVVAAPIALADFEYQIPLSPKLYPHHAAADEPEVLPPSDLRAYPIEMAMVEVIETAPEEGEGDAANAGSGKAGGKTEKAKSGKDKKSKGGSLDDLAASSAAAAGGTAAGFASIQEIRSRGARGTVVVGVVNRRAQLMKLKQALHLETLAQTEAHLEYVDFKIQRQRAVPGPKPWPENEESWVTLNPMVAMEVLALAEWEDADLVAAEYTDAVFTCPLPRRIDAAWDERMVVHPLVPLLTSEERKAERAANEAAADILDEAGEGLDDEEAASKGGFARYQRDAKKMRRAAAATSGDGFSQAMQSYMGGGAAGMAGMGAAMTAGATSGRGNMPGSGMPNMSSIMSGPRGMGGANAMAGGAMTAMAGGANMMTGMGGMGGGGLLSGFGGPAGADVVLFRFFDFDIEPGECYRYRVQLVIRNPSHNEEYVSQPSVAEGPRRDSKFSEPSTPVVAPRDVEYAVRRVPKVATPTRAAELDVVQLDTNAGSLIEGTLAMRFGQYIGGEKELEYLNLGKQSFEKEKVAFISQDLFLDAAAGPKLTGSIQADLNLSPKLLAELSAGQLDQAATVNRFGEVVGLDNSSMAALQPAKARVEEQHARFKDLKNTEKASTADDESGLGYLQGLLGGTKGGKGDKSEKKGRRNSLKGGGMMGMSGMGAMGKMGGMGAMGGMMSGMGMPGMEEGGKSGKKKSGKK